MENHIVDQRMLIPVDIDRMLAFDVVEGLQLAAQKKHYAFRGGK